MLVVAVDEVADGVLAPLVKENPDLVGVPRYWSQAHGYWPKPDIGWRVHE